jgi:nucleotide-binding universal stress UspA family protein
MGRIVVGVDGSRESMAALRWAIEEARYRRAQVETVFVFQNTPSWRLYGYQQGRTAEGLDERDEHALTVEGRDDAHRLVGGMVDKLAHLDDVEVESVVVEDRHPAHVLVERSEGADMLVVGSHGRSGASEMLLGSVSHQCATHASCPIVIIRPRPSS